MMFAFGCGRAERRPADQAAAAGAHRLGVGAGLAVHAGGDARGRGRRVPVVHQVLADREHVVAVGDVRLHGRAAARRGLRGAVGGRRRGGRRGGGRRAPRWTRPGRWPCSRGWRTVRPSASRRPSPTGWPAAWPTRWRRRRWPSGRPGSSRTRPSRRRRHAWVALLRLPGSARSAESWVACGCPLAGDQAVGGRPGHEGCGHPRGRDDPAGPLAGRLAPGVCCMPPGVLVGGPADSVELARLPAVVAAARRRGRTCCCRYAWCLRSRIPLRRSVPGYAVTRGEPLARPYKR